MKSLFIIKHLLPAFALLLFFTACTEQEEFFEKKPLDKISDDLSDLADVEEPVTEEEEEEEIKPDPTPTPIPDPTPTPEPTPELSTVTDSFTQNVSEDAGKIDIVWVIDDSGSMRGEQASIARNFEVFINDFIDRGVDFKMAITTTDPRSSKDGKMVNPPGSLTSVAAAADEAQFIADFKQYIKVGIRGSGDERGLRTSKSFLNKYATSFLRSDAYLIVVIVSDEEDHSRGNTVAGWVDEIRGVKANPGLAKIYTIVDLVSSSRYYRAYRYEEASSLSGGISSDIHQDFYEILLNMGGTILELLDSFAISGIPFEDSISEVRVDGVPQINGWTYDLISRTIAFEEGHVPAEGSNIEVEYKVEVK